MAHLRSQVFPAQVLHSGTLAPALEGSSAGVSVPRPRTGNQHGTRWRGQIPVPPKAHPLVRRLIRLANAQQVTLTEIAKESGVGAHTISNWRYRSAPSLANLEAALIVLGYQLKIVERS